MTKLRQKLRHYELPLLAVVTMAVVVTVYWPTFVRMADMWSHSAYQYGRLVFPVSLYLLWRKRDALAGLSRQTSWLGLTATALLVLLWVVTATVGVQVIEFASAALIIFTLFWAIAGTPAARKAAFPLLLLLAAVPTGEFLVEPLMLVTAEIASGLLLAAGVPVLRDGQFFTLPGGNFEVAAVCSGLRYLLAGIMASAAYAYVTYTRNAKRAFFVAVAALMLVVANGVRAFIVMAVASATNMEIFGGADHVWFGMALFAAVFIGMIWIGEGYADPAMTAPAKTPISSNSQRPFFSVFTASAAAALLITIGGPLFQYAKAQQSEPNYAEIALPALPGCTGPSDWGDGLSAGYAQYPLFAAADIELRSGYDCAERAANVYIAGYRHQVQGKELISSGNRVWPKDWRRFIEESDVSFLNGDRDVDVREVRVRDPRQPRVLWHWYQVGDVVTRSAVLVKALEAMHALRLEPIESSIVVVALAGNRGEAQAAMRERLQPLAEAVMTWNRDRLDGQE